MLFLSDSTLFQWRFIASIIKKCMRTQHNWITHCIHIDVIKRTNKMHLRLCGANAQWKCHISNNRQRICVTFLSLSPFALQHCDALHFVFHSTCCVNASAEQYLFSCGALSKMNANVNANQIIVIIMYA